MQKYLYIEADTNSDCITSLNEITDEDILKILPVIDTIRNFKPYVGTKPDSWEYKHYSNFPDGDCCRVHLGEKNAEELYGEIEGFELFYELTPFGEDGITSIKEIKVVQILEELL